MYLLVLLLPLLASISAGLFGRFLGFRGAALLTTSSVFLSFVISCIAFYEVALSGVTCSIEWMPWFFSEMFDAGWGFYFDSLTVIMLCVITSISTLVHLYSISYMEADPHLPRFMAYLSIFTFFMLMLVTADNFLQMFFGWEGVGLASYLLINFWFTRLQASKASIKAMLVNRVGDFGLALGVMAIFSVFKTVDFYTVFALAAHQSEAVLIFCNIEFHALTVICILLFVGAVGKSAQLGLHTWLPDAMEGPTPVSALIHAATMVTAGVFMIARCSPLFEYAPKALVVVAIVGAMTCFFAATTGVVQNDLKRVIAYSTASQLGYMIFACGISQYTVGVFHLMNHAFFKALLFLSAGSVIHSLSDQQDMRKMGGMAKLLPFTYAMMSIGSFSLVGFPFLTGFYSKDVILEVAFARYTWDANFAYLFGSICVALTSYYSFRLLFLTFIAPTNAYKSTVKAAHDAPFLLALPLFLLSIGSIFVGYCAKDMMIGLATPFWANAIFVLPQNNVLLESEFIPQSQKFLPLIATVAGAVIAYFFSVYSTKTSFALKQIPFFRSLYSFLNKRWYFDKVYNDYISKNTMSFGYNVSFKALDKGFFEICGPTGIAYSFPALAQYWSRLQSGLIYHYAVVMLLGLTMLVLVSSAWSVLENVLDSRILFIYAICFLFYNYYNSASRALGSTENLEK
ncbi:nad5 (mitochondrion) [Auxenochlorella protothecoides x Auxenochlorella symbiontica]|uniref:NADH-ubiquinone oxidoreductase chain 5 n=1 Tax=Auxenochlorella protothecoides TaxID=3075 RepID=A0A0A6ZEF8_AUXPR|nr:NADH dehydrogenase subunit 5 [Auxenochlorella protothecoides]AGN72432.1 NADH dehydrogenase subunit 5 [Auxenochlorella protothecoides]ARV87628.1 NADH-ubiquinone oxidoreductase chain L [Auxenochlorella protothecoides]